MAERFDDADLRAALAPYLEGAERARLSCIPTGKFNTSFFVEANGREYVLRVAPPDDAGFLFYERGMMAQEPELHALVREKTRVPVAEILAHDVTRAHLPRDFILMSRLPGEALSSAAVTRGAAARLYGEVGAALREIHSITRGAYGYLGAHRCMKAQPDWPGAFGVMWNKLLDDIVACGGYSAEEADALRRALDANVKAFGHNPGSHLLHMDVWAQNILCDSAGRLTGIVDFDRALWGDPEIEFAVLDYCGVSTPEFWEGYGRARDRSAEAQVRGVFYYLYELQKYIVIRTLRGAGASQAEPYRREALRLAGRAFGG